MSDNYHFDVCSLGRKHLDMAMELAFACHKEATHYSITSDHGMILFWADPPEGAKATPLPYKMTQKAATDFVWNWLQTASYDPEPDHDGDNDKGFRIYNEAWGHVAGHWQAFVGIAPTWMMFGK